MDTTDAVQTPTRPGSSRFGAASLILLWVLVTGCDRPLETARENGLNGDHFYALAEVLIGEDAVPGGAPRLFENPRAVLDVSPDAVLVVDVHPPFLRLFNGRGEVLAAGGRRGGGPREFERVSAAAVYGDAILAWDDLNGRIAEWSLDPLEPITHHERPPRSLVALAEGCGGRLAAVYGGGAPFDLRRGLQLKNESGGWTDLSDVPPPSSGPVPIVFSSPEFRVVPHGATLAYHDWRSHHIKRLSCADGAVADSVHVDECEAADASRRSPSEDQGLPVLEVGTYPRAGRSGGIGVAHCDLRSSWESASPDDGIRAADR